VFTLWPHRPFLSITSHLQQQPNQNAQWRKCLKMFLDQAQTKDFGESPRNHLYNKRWWVQLCFYGAEQLCGMHSSIQSNYCTPNVLACLGSSPTPCKPLLSRWGAKRSFRKTAEHLKTVRVRLCPRGLQTKTSQCRALCVSDIQRGDTKEREPKTKGQSKPLITLICGSNMVRGGKVMCCVQRRVEC